MYRGSTRDDQRGDRHYGCDRGRSYNHQQRGGGGRVDYNSGNGRFEGQREDGGRNGYNGGGGFRGGGGRGYRGGQAREGGYGGGGGRDGGRGGGYRGGGGYGGAGGSEGYGGGGYGGGRGGRGRGEYINGRRDGWDSRKRPHEGDFDAENGERAPKSKFVQVAQPIVPYPIEVDIIGVINGQEAKMDFKSASGASIASIKEVHIYGEVEHCLPMGNELMLFLCNKVGPFFENGVQICGNETLSSASQNLISIASGLFSKSQFVQLGNNQLALLKVPLIECMAEIWVDVSPECGILDVTGYWFKALFEWLWGKKARRKNSNPKRLLINLPNEQFAIHWVEQFSKDPGDMPYQVLIRCGQYKLFPRELKREGSTFSLQLTGQNEYLFSKNPIDEPRPGNLTFASARALPKVLFANKPKPNA